MLTWRLAEDRAVLITLVGLDVGSGAGKGPPVYAYVDYYHLYMCSVGQTSISYNYQMTLCVDYRLKILETLRAKTF